MEKANAQSKKTAVIFNDPRLEVHSGFYQVNGVVLKDSLRNVVPVHYPGFDTVYYAPRDSAKASWNFFITRFKPGEKYVVVPSCCTSVDLVEEKKVKSYMKEFLLHYNESPKSRYYTFMAPVTVSFRLEGQQPTDTLLGVFGEWSGFPFGVMLRHTASRYYRADKGFYWNNITHLLIARNKKNIKLTSENPEITEDVWIENLEVLESISFRFFGNEKLDLVYNSGTGKLSANLAEKP